ncbi:hypothetical protein [Streptomyces sp. MP131-18]|uniref:hypothetical protein n=1 Tax=Streptomyces sp. MP131-18 TaxID=1857892 RepID=UPI00097C1EAA|nr:hypothetical protein [Streptomyces sp. MP131-18]ONK13149.1 hypothetical protein STBA_39110 [Streptomyces sp. MP131-18]
MAWWQIHRRTKHEVVDLGDGSVRYRPAGTAVLASAALVSRSQVRAAVGRKEGWQAQAWELYDAVPEIHSGTRWAANACSRTRLYAGSIDPDGSSEPVPVDAQDADADPELVARLLAPLEELAGGQTGQSEMLRRLSIHLDVPGESYLIGFDADGERRWHIASPDEVTTLGADRVRVQLPDGPTARIDLSPESSTIVRLWHPHARLAYRADSPMHALRDPLRELQGLSAHVIATTDSRLAGAGLLLASQDVVPAAPTQSDGPNPMHGSPVAEALLESMAVPLRDRDSAASIVPLLLTAPGEVRDKLQHLTFATPLDEQILPLRDAAIRRVAIGMDMPPEILLGMGNVNHWGQWLIEESGIKLHVEPKLGLICDALTTSWYRPALEALGVPEPGRYAVWYDTSDLRQRPNRGPEAAQAHERGVLSDAAYLRELGFSTEDMPDEEEQRRRLLLQLALSTPQLAPAALTALGMAIPGLDQPARTEGPRAPVASRPEPAELPRSGPPEPPAVVTASAADMEWRTNCLDMAVLRALERAGQWLLNRGSRSLRGQYRDVPLHRIHVVLGAEQDQLDQMLAGAYREFIAATPEEHCLHQAIDHYVRALLLAREDHHRDYLARAIQQAGCDQAA